MDANMPVESARAPSGETSPDRTALRSCVVCGGEIPLSLRADAEHCRAACRARGSRERHAGDPGPTLSEVIATRRRYLVATAKGEATVKNFDVVVRSLAPFADRHVGAITKEEWGAWWATSTANFRESTKAMWARTVKTMLKEVPHWFGAVVPFTPQPPPSPAPILPRRRTARLKFLLKTERTRLALALLLEGFLPIEIRTFTCGAVGEIIPGKPAWGRRDMPSVPKPLLERLQAYANSKGLSPGTRLFPVSRAAIYAVASTAGRKRGLTVSCSALARSARHR